MSVIDKLRSGRDFLLKRDIAGPNLAVYPDDTFIVSYPKSGNTWTRFLIANLLQPDKPITLVDMDRIVPDRYGQTRQFFNTLPRPRFIKDHGAFNPLYKNVIYIVRDPRDVVISGYHFMIKGERLEEGYTLERFVHRFAKEAKSPYGSWGENVASWMATRGDRPRFLLLRYEDMLAQPSRELGKVASFLGLEASPDRLAQAVERGSADSMRKLEKMHGDKWAQTKNMKRKDIPFVRSATSGGWRSVLPASAVAEIESTWGPLMMRLGYELSTAELNEVAVTADRSRAHV